MSAILLFNPRGFLFFYLSLALDQNKRKDLLFLCYLLLLEPTERFSTKKRGIIQLARTMVRLGQTL